MVPKTVVQNKLKALDDYENVLQTKDGDKEVEEKLGVKLVNKYHTISYLETIVPDYNPHKEKSYFEKKKEQQEIEQKN